MALNDYQLSNCVSLSPVQESNRDRLLRIKKSVDSTSKDIERALEILNKYPEIEELNDILRRI